MKTLRAFAIGLALLGLAGCGNAAASASAEDSSTPSVSVASSAASVGCAADDLQVALSADPAWQVCLPADVKAVLAFGEPPTFRATVTLDGSEFVVAKLKIVDDAEFGKLNPKAWLQLADNAGSHILIDRSFNVAADVSAAQLAELTKISGQLADPQRYSLAG